MSTVEVWVPNSRVVKILKKTDKAEKIYNERVSCARTLSQIILPLRELYQMAPYSVSRKQ